MQYYADLTSLGNRYSEQFYAELLDSEGQPRRPRRAPSAADANGDGQNDDPAVEEVPIELHAPLGKEVATRFGMENTEDHPVTLTLSAGPCHGPNGDVFLAPLAVSPAEVTLAPGETRQVSLRLLLLPASFTPGFLYRMPVEITGATPVRLQLTIWAEEPHTPGVDPRPEPPAPEPAAAQRPPAKAVATARKSATKRPAAKTAAQRSAASKRVASKRTAPKRTAPPKRAASKRTAAKRASKRSTS